LGGFFFSSILSLGESFFSSQKTLDFLLYLATLDPLAYPKTFLRNVFPSFMSGPEFHHKNLPIGMPLSVILSNIVFS